MKEIFQHCPICKSTSRRFILAKDRDGRRSGTISIFQCNNCQTVHLGSYTSGFDAPLYDYYEKYKGSSKEILFNPFTAYSYRKLLNLLAHHTRGKDILDVGCGMGAFVDTCTSAGWNPQGIDLSKPAVEIAQSFGLPVKNLDFFCDSIRPKSFDVITMFEVIEHLPDPVSFLQRAEAVVKPGGLVYLTTPNFGSIDRRVLGKEWSAIHREHLTYFTPSTLKTAVKASSGFLIERLETHNLSTHSIKSLTHSFWGNSSNERALSTASNDESIRSLMYSSRSVRKIVQLSNFLLNLIGRGNTIKVLLRRPHV